jgi:hypothetical protein
VSDYDEFWPGVGNLWIFTTSTEEVITRYKEREDPLPPRKIEAELNHLRVSLKKLSSETRKEINDRELSQWQNIRHDGAIYDEGYFKKQRLIEGKGSALILLENSVADKFEREYDRDAIKRKDLIAQAALVFSVCGGKIKAGAKSDFVKYIQHLLFDIGLEKADCPKAVRDFIEKHPGVLD